MLAPAFLNDLAEQPQLFYKMQPALAAKLPRGSPGPSFSNNDSHDVTGIAPCTLATNDVASKPQLLAHAGGPATQANDDCQCSADSMHLHSASPNASPPPDHHPPLAALPGPLSNATIGLEATDMPDGKHPSGSSKRSRTGDLKKARMVWSEELHNMFLRALSDIGLRHAVPKTIMQRMGVHTLSRENVASHLQKYRLALKRKAGLPDNTLMTSASWRQLEQAHEDFVASIPTATAAAPLAPMPHMPTPSPPPAAPTAISPRYADPQPPAAKTQPVPVPAAKRLPPLPPLSAAEKLPSQPFAGLAPAPCGRTGLPRGFTVPLPNSDGVAVGIPMPAPLFAKDVHGPRGSARASHSCSNSARPTRGTLPGLPSSNTPPPSTGPTEPPLRPLGMPDASAALMPHMYPFGAADGQASTSGGSNKLCTVYMYNPTTCGSQGGDEAAQAHTLVKPAQVPQMLLSVSAAAYNSMAGGAAVPDMAAIAAGAPAQTGSTGSASRPVSGGDEESTVPGKRRRRMSVRVRELPGEQEASTRRPRSHRASPISRASAAARTTPTAPAAAYTGPVEAEWGGDSSALDMLAEIAGRLADGEGLQGARR